MRQGGCGKWAGTWFPGSLRHLEAGACQQPQVIGQAGRLSRLLSNLSSKVWRELVHMASQKRCLPRAGEGEAEDRHITLTYRGDRVARVSRESLSVGMGVLNRNRDLM